MSGNSRDRIVQLYEYSWFGLAAGKKLTLKKGNGFIEIRVKCGDCDEDVATIYGPPGVLEATASLIAEMPVIVHQTVIAQRKFAAPS